MLRQGFGRPALILFLGLVGTLIGLSPLGWRMEQDLGLLALFRARGPIDPPESLIIVRLDQASIDRFASLPAEAAAWPDPIRSCAGRGGLDQLSQVRSLDRLPRQLHACLVDLLAGMGVSVLAFDVAFSDDPQRSPGTERLASAIAAHGRTVLLMRAQRSWEETAGGNPQPSDAYLPVHPLLAQAAAATAPFQMPRTGARFHQFWTVHPSNPQAVQLPTRMLELWHRARGVEPDAIGRDNYLNFYGPAGTIPNVGLGELLTGATGAGQPIGGWEGAAVIVGLFEPRLTMAQDSFPTVYGDQRGLDLSGVEIAATAFADMRDGRTLRLLPEGLRAVLLWSLGSLLAATVLHWRIGRASLVAIGIAGAWTGLAFAAFCLFDLWLPVAVPILVSLPLALGLGWLKRYHGVARWLGVYATAPAAQAIIAGADRTGAAAERAVVTIMFTDIVGFSTVSEKLDPGEIADFVNAHFDLLTDVVEREGGTVAQFTGDSLMAYWSASSDPGHAAAACRAALAIAHALVLDNVGRGRSGLLPIRIRIGINTGAAIAGNVGARSRGLYTLMGDAVNTAQRIEQLAKQLCTDRPTAAVLVGRATREAVGDGFAFEDLGPQPIRGRHGHERLFRLLGTGTVSHQEVHAASGPLSDHVQHGHGQTRMT